MSLGREDMLRELELLPVWHLRVQSGEHPSLAETPSQAQVQEVSSAAQQHDEPVQSVQDEVAEPAPAFSQADDAPVLQTEFAEEAGMPTTEQLGYFDEESSTFPAALAPQPGLLEPVRDRRAGIMEMNWQALQADVPTCTACSLAATRTQTVFGVGDPHAEWLFIGEAPGAEEDRRGEPFVGPAGKLLDNMLAAIKLKRGENVYIANVLKCRPPANRDPQGEEVVKCDPYLKRQVELIKPKLIVALGKFAAQSLLASQSSIAGLRGRLHDFHGVPVIVTYHPAYLLRNLPDKARAWDDLCFALDTMRGLQSAVATPSVE
ncbi:uracil-DNA glycosylase [Methylobacillus caricis]|uniref:uracil-DNA glycosylase n=1 Tax=Methylobacillus caricis TaxID=1971611 RepID=UPI001CFFF864|nr:uracil-DNA glycosylase [Methylobacillus caricis]MCB5186515.1 uracil-DNA glycosylase [Methylobacillus caricis]